MTAPTTDPVTEDAPETDEDSGQEAAEPQTTEEIVEQVHTALAIKPDQKKWTTDQIAVMKALGWQDVEQMTPAEIMHFNYFCAENNVNPLLRQAMPLKTKDGVIPIMQIAGMRKRADDTGEYEGLTPHFEFQDETGAWHEGWAFEGVEPVACRIGVYKRGWRDAVEGSVQTAEAKVLEPVKDGDRIVGWKLAERWKALIRMLKISAEADGLRRAFPQALSGFYTPEETHRIKREREEAHLRKVAAESRAARRRVWEDAQQAKDEPVREEREEGVQEGVIVSHGPVHIADVMDAATRLRRSAQAAAGAPADPEAAGEETAPDWGTPPAESPSQPGAPESAAPEVPADLPLTEEQQLECLRAELAEQAAIMGVPVEEVVKPFAALYEGEPLSTWDSGVLLSIVAFWRPRVVKRLRALSRYEEARAYDEAGTEYVDAPDVLFGRRSVQPVSDGS